MKVCSSSDLAEILNRDMHYLFLSPRQNMTGSGPRWVLVRAEPHKGYPNPAQF